VVLLLVQVAPQGPAIRLVPQLVDRHFAERRRLCAGEATGTGFPVSNDTRRSVQEFLGRALVELQIHQIGESLMAFSKARFACCPYRRNAV
jgi:hypothetical protein